MCDYILFISFNTSLFLLFKHISSSLNESQDISDDSPPPLKEQNEEVFLGSLFTKFQSFQPGEQQFLIGEINKLFEGTYTMVAIEEPQFDPAHRFRGRPKGAKRKHVSTTSSKRDPSQFEYQENMSQKRRESRKKVRILEPKVCYFLPGFFWYFNHSIHCL